LKIKPTESKAKIFVADKKEIFFMVTHDGSEDEMGVWLDSPFFSESLCGIVDKSMSA